ncbi:MAG: hypothetical protein IJ513_00365 [Bacteroidaceae bacterium]|nr:hypothetical protein [Bacteroidaceae bacterium]
MESAIAVSNKCPNEVIVVLLKSCNVESVGVLSRTLVNSCVCTLVYILDVIVVCIALVALLWLEYI